MRTSNAYTTQVCYNKMNCKALYTLTLQTAHNKILSIKLRPLKAPQLQQQSIRLTSLPNALHPTVY